MGNEIVKIEVNIYGIESALAAGNGGADRVELCSSLFEGGTTPSYGMMKEVRKLLDIEVFTIIRPRGGDFLYNSSETEVMLINIDMAKNLGLDGVVVGALNRDGTIDMETMKQLIERAYPLEITFHRAFDLTPDPYEALEQTLELGVNRILTSGQQDTAFNGIPLIKSLVETADEKLIIMAGSGINEENVKTIIQATGIKEFHISARSTRASEMNYKPNGIPIGDPRFSEFTHEVTDVRRVKKFRSLIEA